MQSDSALLVRAGSVWQPALSCSSYPGAKPVKSLAMSSGDSQTMVADEVVSISGA